MIINSEVADLCKKIEKICTKDGKVDLEDMDKRLAMLFVDRCLDDVKYKRQPNKPDGLLKYEALPKDKKFLFNKENPDWRRMPTIQDYMDKSSAASAENSSNVYWIKHWMTKTDPVRAEKLKQKLMEFEIHMPKPTVEPTPVTESQPEEVQEILESFGGQVIKGGWKTDTHFRRRKK